MLWAVESLSVQPEETTALQDAAKSQASAEAVAIKPKPEEAKQSAEVKESASEQTEETTETKQAEQIEKQKVFLQALCKKLKLPLPEVVRIQDVDYPVPKPWAGNRVRVPYDTAENLALIPTDLTLDGMEIALRKEALAQLERMAVAAREAGITLLVDSGYRSAAYQRDIYERRMEEGLSFERIARHTAPPGYSSHALGTAVDFHPSGSGFQKTKAYSWLKQQAKNYGFHETYFKGNAFGMTWEPWHWEYRLIKKKPAEIVVAARKDKTEAPAATTNTATTQPEAKPAAEEKTNAETTNAQTTAAAAEPPTDEEKQ
ncbi:MAG: M15 family metallopeptidase [bacterium]|nr:M15 family metallopeptidase [bacterium]